MTGKSFKIALAAVLTMLQLNFGPQAHAFSFCDFSGDIRLDTGYRWDKLNNRVSLFGEDFPARVSSQELNHINTFLLGTVGHLVYKSWFLKGEYHYGWIGNGKYDEGGFNGKLHGHTVDGSAALGYIFPVNACIWFAPLAGWSYDSIRTNARHVRVGLNGSVVDVGGIQCRSRFQGPWIGTDIIFQPCCNFQIVLGHELHYAHYRGTRFLNDGELGEEFGITTGFSNVRKHKHMWGQLFRLDFSYMYCKMWDFGFELKYQTWNAAGNGRYKRTRVPTPPEVTSERLNDVEWQSFTATLHVGYMF